MKKLLFIIYIFLNMSMFAQQSGRIIYKVVQDSTYDNSEAIKKMKQTVGDYYKQIIKKTNTQYEIAKEFRYNLDFNVNESLYHWEEATPDELTPSGEFYMAVLLGGGKGSYYNNLKEKIFYKQDYIEGMGYKKVILNKRIKDWKITKETSTILGYPVIKAVHGKTAVWFTPQIPIAFGPATYNGLPGMVLKFQFRNRIIIADKIILYKKRHKIKKPTKGEFITESDLIKAYREADARRFGEK